MHKILKHHQWSLDGGLKGSEGINWRIIIIIIIIKKGQQCKAGSEWYTPY